MLDEANRAARGAELSTVRSKEVDPGLVSRINQLGPLCVEFACFPCGLRGSEDTQVRCISDSKLLVGVNMGLGPGRIAICIAIFSQHELGKAPAPLDPAKDHAEMGV